MKQTAHTEIGIREYLLAGYPCIYAIAEDTIGMEREIVETIRKENLELNIFSWKVTSGLSDITEDMGTVNEMIRQGTGTLMDLNGALREILKSGPPDSTDESRKPGVYIYHNVRKVLNHPLVIQNLIDAIHYARYVGSHIFLIGAPVELEEELTSLVTIYRRRPPTKSDIYDEYIKFVSRYKKALQLKGTKDEIRDNIRKAADAACGLSMMGAENAMALSIAVDKGINIPIIQNQKVSEINKSDVLYFIKELESADNLGDFDEFKKWIDRRKRIFTDEAREANIPYPKGILIVGVPGTGKSLCAKVVASSLGLPLIRLDMARVFKSLQGKSEETIRVALETAETVSPCILWIDEVEKGLSGLQSSGVTDSGTTSKITQTILTWRQETKYPVFLVMTANQVEKLPPEFYRPGRVDCVWATDMPGARGRQEIIKIHIRKAGSDPINFDITRLVKVFENFVGSEIEACIQEGKLSAFQDGVEMSNRHIIEAVGDMVPQAVRDKESIDHIREWVKTRARLVNSPLTIASSNGELGRKVSITKK